MDYWQKQQASTPLFPDIEWNRPQQKSMAGRLAIIGGNKLGFMATAESHTIATKTGAGTVRVLLPDALKKSVPPTITDVIFAPTNPSGSLANDALNEVRLLMEWADVSLFCGDAGKNSQTAILYETALSQYEKTVILARDAVDLVMASVPELLQKRGVILVVSFAQLQKIFRAVYYPKMLTFSMQLSAVVEALHKFTITYPITVATLHAGQYVLANGGNVVTQADANPMALWRGIVAAKIATYALWSPNHLLESAATSLAE